jgi:LysM repeat protein
MVGITLGGKGLGLPITEPVSASVATPTNGPTVEKKDPSVQAGPSIAPGNYEVKRGDALAIIARKSGVPVSQLKRFNGLEKDVIRIGQILKFSGQLIALAPQSRGGHASAITYAGAKGKKSPEKRRKPEIDSVASHTIRFSWTGKFFSGSIDGTKAVLADVVRDLPHRSPGFADSRSVAGQGGHGHGRPLPPIVATIRFSFISPPGDRVSSRPVRRWFQKAGQDRAVLPTAPRRQ